MVINILSNRSEWTFYFLSSVQFNFTIGHYFILNEGKELSTEELLSHVWRNDKDANSDIVWIYVSYLRQKLQSIQSSVKINGIKDGNYSLVK